MAKDDNTQIDSAAKGAAAPPVGAQAETPLTEIDASKFDQLTAQQVVTALIGSLQEVARLAPSNDVRSAFVSVQREFRKRLGIA